MSGELFGGKDTLFPSSLSFAPVQHWGGQAALGKVQGDRPHLEQLCFGHGILQLLSQDPKVGWQERELGPCDGCEQSDAAQCQGRKSERRTECEQNPCPERPR